MAAPSEAVVGLYLENRVVFVPQRIDEVSGGLELDFIGTGVLLHHVKIGG